MCKLNKDFRDLLYLDKILSRLKSFLTKWKQGTESTKLEIYPLYYVYRRIRIVINLSLRKLRQINSPIKWTLIRDLNPILKPQSNLSIYLMTVSEHFGHFKSVRHISLGPVAINFWKEFRTRLPCNIRFLEQSKLENPTLQKRWSLMPAACNNITKQTDLWVAKS